MRPIFERILALISEGAVMISEHGYDELADDEIFARNVLGSVIDGVVVEEYPDYHKGPCVLVWRKDRSGAPIHVVWGIPKGKDSPAVLITAYRPDARRWSPDWLRRRK